MALVLGQQREGARGGLLWLVGGVHVRALGHFTNEPNAQTYSHVCAHSGMDVHAYVHTCVLLESARRRHGESSQSLSLALSSPLSPDPDDDCPLLLSSSDEELPAPAVLPPVLPPALLAVATVPASSTATPLRITG